MDVISTIFAIGGGLKAGGILRQSAAESDAAKANATLAMQSTDATYAQGVEAEALQRRRAAEVLGMQRAGLAQAGIGSGGSALDVGTQSAVNAEMDALMIRYQRDLQARGYLAEAAQQKSNAKAIKQSGYWAAAGTILGSVGDYMGAKSGGTGMTSRRWERGHGIPGTRPD